MVSSPVSTTPDSDQIGDWEQWHADRLQGLTAPTGNLSLVETRWLDEGVDAEAVAADIRSSAASTITVTTLERTSLDSGRPEHGIRVWDAASRGIRAFETVSTFAYDPDWVLRASFTPASSGRTIPFEHLRDNGLTRALAVPGDIHFEHDGERFTMSAFDDGGVLLLVFGDPTNGADGEDGTYASGRFLFVQKAEAFDEAGEVVLDFNRAFVPPCGFSIHYNCPLPPQQNRFHTPVRAGEKVPVFADGFSLYEL
jgi:uncharacterized protein (DUF1684 family)